MDGYVILVEFTMKPGKAARFAELVRENAAASVRDEPGCRRFDVLIPRDGREVVTLYEIYHDRAAFEAHLATPHYARFRDAIEGLVAERRFGDHDLHENVKPGA
jgi:quinol monooxygenase YgiN